MPGGAVAFISSAEVRERLPFAAAADILADAFAVEDGGAPPRTALPFPGGELLLMPAHGAEGVGVKLLTLNTRDAGPGRPFVQGVYVLFGGDGLAPEAILDGAALTERRTAAVSALATRRLAREDAERLVVFGAGVQARAHVEAMCAIRPIRATGIVGRDPDRARRLVDELRATGIAAELVGPEAVAEADVICTCTSSSEPVLDARLVRAGAHVNAVGAHRPDTRELPAELLARARIAVETRESALAEAGDVLMAIDAGAITTHDIAGDLGSLARGELTRSDADEITVFKSVGVAREDLVLARAALARHRG